MKKLILTIAFGVFFIAFSNAQSTEAKKEVKTEYTVEKSETTSPSADAKASCHGKKATKACCAGKKTAKASSCAGKSKASCAGKSKASCAGKAKATKETL